MKVLLAFAFLLSVLFSFGQEANTIIDSGYTVTGQKYVVRKPLSFHRTGNVRDWVNPNNTDTVEAEHNEFSHSRNKRQRKEPVDYPDLQTDFGVRGISAPLVNFEGQIGDLQNPPPDPSGAAGPNHYVQAVNWSFQVFDKNGVALTASTSLSFFSGIVVGDPIVLYDRHADRWVITYLSIFSVVIAVSETSDPTGSFYVYNYNYSPGLPDYPKYSVWWDGYYMTANSLTNNASVFERIEMLAGNPSAQFITLTEPGISSINILSAPPSDADGPIPPNGTPCNFFLLEDDNASSATQDQIKIYEMITDWITPANTQMNISQQLPVTPFDGSYPTETISQPGSQQRLDGIEGIFMYRAQHRRWIGYNTILLTHTVDVGTTTAIRWYELRDNDDGIWYIYQSGTYMPDNANRWIPSIAMDDNGNIGLGFAYCDSVANQYPGIHYTGRLASDPLGQMTFNEEEAQAGAGYQNVNNRFGDYSALALDADGNTFWHTCEYLETGGAVKTRIYSFQLFNDTGIENLVQEIQLTVSANGTAIFISAEGIPDDEKIMIEIIGMDGRVLASSRQKSAGGKLTHSFRDLNLSTGIYFVRVGNSKFQKCERLFLGK